MADTAWIHVHAYDDDAKAIVETCLNESDICRIHIYVPLVPGDWRFDAGLRTELHLVNGSIVHCTETFDALKTAIKAKGV